MVSKSKGDKRRNSHGGEPNRQGTAVPGGGGVAASLSLSGMSAPQRIAWLALLALVFVVPLAMGRLALPGAQTPITFDQFDLIKTFVIRVCVSIGLAAWAWHILIEGGRLRRSKVDYLIVALLGWVALTTITSIHPQTALFGTYRRYEGFLTYLTYAGTFFLAIQLLDRGSRIRTLAKTFFWSAAVVNAYAVLQYLGLDPVEWGPLSFEENRAFSFFGNPELLAGYVVMSLTIALSLALAEERTSWRAVYWSGFVVALVSWIATFTRGAWIAGAVALLVMLVVVIMTGVKLRGVDKAFLGAGGAAGAALVALSLSATNEVMNVWLRLSSILDFSTGSAGNRFRIWQSALDAVADRPILGFGADTFKLVFPKYRPIDYLGDGYLTVADNVHNYPLQLAVALGIPGLLLVIAVFGYAAYSSAPTVFLRSESASADRLVLAGFWAACVGYLAHLFFALSITSTTVLLWVATAAVLAPSARSIQVGELRWGRAGAVSAAVLAAAVVVASFVPLHADNLYVKSKLAQGQDRVALAEKAARALPYESAYRSEISIARMDVFVEALLQVDAVRGTASEQAARSALQGVFVDTERAMLDAMERSPWEFENYIFLANLYAAAGDYIDPTYYDRSIEVARTGIEDRGFTYDARLRFQLARGLHARGQSQEAFEHIKLAAQLAPDYPEAQLLFAEIARELGEPAGTGSVPDETR
ncbi:MAG: O-antigen ligase family protein [Coriobacteriia bacterium]|nr:O-antigen ligase family protein [Coriobacteriia bacterium]